MNLKCHCGNISIQIDSKPDTLTVCNCSICHRYGSIWGYYNPNRVEINVGGLGFSAYIWGDKCIEFVHCKQCGCVTHYQTLQGDLDPRIAVNFRMMDSIELENIPVRKFDGASAELLDKNEAN